MPLLSTSPTANNQNNSNRLRQLVPPSSPTSAIAGYAITEFIGRGSYSTVYKAHKNRGDYEVVAIKCIQISTLSAKSRDNLFNEINIMRRINHQHVVAMKKFTWDAKHVYLILEYCPGGNLAEFIRLKGRLSEFMVQHFAQQLVQGLEVLHAEKIVHSDLKPANILLSIPPVGSCRNVKLKIADFGFSHKLQANEEYTMGIKGSPLYMAPEVLHLQPYSSQADLYSLGVILYECLFGSAPYKTLDLSKLTKMILSSDPIKIPKAAHLSDNCYDLLQRLLEKDQEKRANYDELYMHPFIDMEHSPCWDNYIKGVSLVRQATIFDNARNFDDPKASKFRAQALYTEGLRYLVPAYYWLDSFNDKKRKQLNMRVQEYCARAEELKLQLISPAKA